MEEEDKYTEAEEKTQEQIDGRLQFKKAWDAMSAERKSAIKWAIDDIITFGSIQPDTQELLDKSDQCTK